MSERAPRVLVVGGGISGLTAARELAATGSVEVVLCEADDRLGGKILTSPFGGLDAVDEGPDAYLTRVPDAAALVGELDLSGGLTHPTGASAAVWHHGLHPIPEGLMLGVPAAIGPMARTRLLSWRGKARAALEPLRPRTSLDGDALGPYVRTRFGDEVHERLVDALIGSIYAADTDRFSLAAVPQLDGLARAHRSLLIGGRRARAKMPAAPAANGAPIFAAPRDGLGALVTGLTAHLTTAGVTLHTGRRVERIEPDGHRWRVDGESFDHVVLASPARATAPLLRDSAPDAADLLAGVDHAGVILVTLAVSTWPERLRGRSGYLVPKPVQRTVTAASFGSQKWAHWRPDDGSEVLRISLGRDGLEVGHLDDDAVIARVVDEVGGHLDIDLQPTAVRISRWPAAFPQYRPHHADRVARLERVLPAGVHIAGASHHGIGIPACIRSARAAARKVLEQAGIDPGHMR